MPESLLLRTAIFLFSILLAYKMAYKETPELDGVKNAGMYKISYALLIARGSSALWLCIFGYNIF